MEQLYSPKKIILSGVVLFCLGLIVWIYTSKWSLLWLSANSLYIYDDTNVICLRSCPDGSRIDANQMCPICGNNIVEGSETCDDGNTNSNDGCSSSCSPDTIVGIPYCGNGTCDSNEDCGTCSWDCGTCSINSGSTYSYCYDYNACNYYNWVENGTCDYSCCQQNYHRESGACVSDTITCSEIDGELQLMYSNWSTDFANRVVALGQSDPNISRYEIFYSATTKTFKADMYVDGIQIPCPSVTIQNSEPHGDQIGTCQQMLENMHNSGESTDGISCTGDYSFAIEVYNK